MASHCGVDSEISARWITAARMEVWRAESSVLEGDGAIIDSCQSHGLEWRLVRYLYNVLLSRRLFEVDLEARLTSLNFRRGECEEIEKK